MSWAPRFHSLLALLFSPAHKHSGSDGQRKPTGVSSGTITETARGEGTAQGIFCTCQVCLGLWAVCPCKRASLRIKRKPPPRVPTAPAMPPSLAWKDWALCSLAGTADTTLVLQEPRRAQGFKLQAVEPKGLGLNPSSAPLCASASSSIKWG